MVIPGRCAHFVSGPLTAAHPASQQQNIAAMQRFAEGLRRSDTAYVICPATFAIEGWRGSDYRELFDLIIGAFAIKVHFLDDWHRSVGSSLEMIYCIKHAIACVDAKAMPIAADEARAHISESVGAGRYGDARKAALVRDALATL